MLALQRRKKLVWESPIGSNRGDTLDVWAAEFGLKPKKKSTPGPKWCGIGGSVAAREAGLPFWTPMAYGFVIQAGRFGYRVIPAQWVRSGWYTPNTGDPAVRRGGAGEGNHIDFTEKKWKPGSVEGPVIGANVSNKITSRIGTCEAHNKWSYTHFVEI